MEGSEMNFEEAKEICYNNLTYRDNRRPEIRLDMTGGEQLLQSIAGLTLKELNDNRDYVIKSVRYLLYLHGLGLEEWRPEVVKGLCCYL
jgi:hypothetical protein